MKPGLMTFLQTVSNSARFLDVRYVQMERLGDKVFATFLAQPPKTAILLKHMAEYWSVDVQMRARGADADVTLVLAFDTEELAHYQEYSATVDPKLFGT